MGIDAREDMVSEKGGRVRLERERRATFSGEGGGTGRVGFGGGDVSDWHTTAAWRRARARRLGRPGERITKAGTMADIALDMAG